MDHQNKWVSRIKKVIKNCYKEIKPLIGTNREKRRYSRGAGGDITLEIDKIAEEKIIGDLKKFRESFIVISEEIGLYYWNAEIKKEIRNFKFEEIDCKTYFVIDPIDGSRNASRGIPLSCISIALADGPELKNLQVGMVLNISTGDLYSSERGKGAFLNGKPIKCSKITEMKKSFVGTDIDSHRTFSALMNIQNKFLDQVSKIHILGSCALELCFVAQGALDLYIDFREKIRNVDIAAGLLIVQEAGGFTVDSKFNEFESNLFSLSERHSFIAGTSSLKIAVKKFID